MILTASAILRTSVGVTRVGKETIVLSVRDTRVANMDVVPNPLNVNVKKVGLDCFATKI